MTLLHGLAILLLCQSAGEAAVRLLHLPLPGPVLGLLLLMVALGWQRLRAPAGQAADALLQHLSLLFEGSRWVDMRRWGRLGQLPIDTPGMFVAKVMPIPQAECDARRPVGAPASVTPRGCEGNL